MKDFQLLALNNRLGQPVAVQVKRELLAGRHYVFVETPAAAVYSLVAKNAEHFARQLLEHYELEPAQFEMIEVCTSDDSELSLTHWHFEWVGHAPVKPRSHPLSARSRSKVMQALVA